MERQRQKRSKRAIKRQRFILTNMPEQLIEFPFEVIIAFWGVVGSVPLFLNIVKPPTLETALPFVVFAIFKTVFLVGSVLMAIALLNFHFFPLLHRAMQLVGYVLLSYAVVLITVAKLSAVPAAGIMLACATVLFLRSWWIRTSAMISEEINREAD